MLQPNLEKRPCPIHLTPADLPEDVARFAEAQIATGRFASVDELISAGIESRNVTTRSGKGSFTSREAWDRGLDSLRVQIQHG